jgi:hypothetical protein
MSQVQATEPQTTTPNTQSTPSSASASGLRAAASRVDGFAAQAALLSPVQRKGGGEDASEVHAAAAQGISGSGGALPHAAQIQRSFGAYDVSHVTAHTDSAAAAGSAAMGAEAYATGSHVAFGGSPSLHTAAHEAAHVVQQQAGVSLSGGVGKSGDAYEQHADKVADAVVAGQSAEPLLAQMAGGGGGGAVQAKAVQRHEGLVQRTEPAAAGGGAGASHTAAPGSFEALGARVRSIAATVSSGHFANVTLNVAFPVAAVPGLNITVGVQGSIATEANGQKEFNCQLSGGAQYGLGRICNVNAAVSGSLQLRGDDLGASLVDAVKQSLHVALQTAGVDSALNAGHESLNNPRTRTERLIAWGVGEEFIATFNDGYRGYFEFFRNNGAVGFEASVAISLGAGASSGRSGASGTLEARTGIEDVNNEDAQAFAELAGQVQGNVGNSGASVRYSKRARSGGQTTVAIEVNGQLSMPRNAFSPSGQLTFMEAVRTGSFCYKIFQFARALHNARDGATLREGLDVASTTCNLGTAAFGTSGDLLDALMGIEVKVSQTAGVWTVERARFKSMTQAGTGTGQSVGGVEANVQVGTFIDFTGTVNEGLAAYRGS